MVSLAITRGIRGGLGLKEVSLVFYVILVLLLQICIVIHTKVLTIIFLTYDLRNHTNCSTKSIIYLHYLKKSLMKFDRMVIIPKTIFFPFFLSTMTIHHKIGLQPKILFVSPNRLLTTIFFRI